MKKYLLLLLITPLCTLAQKKPLDHSVYDGWQSITERLISHDGKWVVYTVSPQEGDGELYVRSFDGTSYVKKVPRGYNATISYDSRFVFFKIKPPYKDTREARIKKKKPEDLPKDSIGMIELGQDNIWKTAKVKAYKAPVKSGGWLAYLKEKDPSTSRSAGTATQRTVDSLRKTIDSLTFLVNQLKNAKSGSIDGADADEESTALAAGMEGSDLVVRNLSTGKEKLIKNVTDFYFNDLGQKLAIKVTKSGKDSLGKNAMVIYDLKKGSLDTVLKGNDFRSVDWSEDGRKLAFVAERDSNAKSLQKFYGLYLYNEGEDSAELIINKKSQGMQLGMTVSEFGQLNFSKSGNRLLFGTAPIQPPKDTTIVDFEVAKLDIWNYKDDYLQTQQLFRVNNELKRSYTAVYDIPHQQMVQLGNPGLPEIIPTNEGDGDYFIAVTDTGRRVESQWTGSTKKDIYTIQVATGERTLVKKNLDGLLFPSSTGKYILLYDVKAKNYFSWNGKELKNITTGIKQPLYNEENDVPDDPGPYGIMGWHEKDSAVYVYDKYDVWKVDPAGVNAPAQITSGRSDKNTFRYLKLDSTERYISSNQPLYFRVMNETSKNSGLAVLQQNTIRLLTDFAPAVYNVLLKAKDKAAFVYSKESYVSSPDLYSTIEDAQNAGTVTGWHLDSKQKGWKANRLSTINPQQAQYNWGTSELFYWKAFDGQPATGILYKPEDFDSTRKYPMIIYFYEKLSDGLNSYMAPAPTPSRLNIPFFVSRGYLVFAPDITYTKGHPGKGAYNYIVSGAQALSKYRWVDAKNIGIQGQSWGGYQVSYLITATNMFKAAWAGAPVVNMFSAYGGIRWESGSNRQMQYERGQSRIGATPWEHPELYIENSPFFHLKKVTTPLVIMANDADGAVPWYQGIEFFTAMRRLNKKVWMLNYNGEAHNLVERRNRKDIQIREQQYFDWLLKGEKPAKWLTEGVPAIKKGKDWGLELEGGVL